MQSLTIKKIRVWSIFKVSLVLYLVAGVILGLIGGGLITGLRGATSSGLLFSDGVVGGILLGLLYGIIGAIVNTIIAALAGWKLRLI
ncbi:MAG: hypothetical protein ACYCX4_04905 [Bacillota bacterium]